MIPNMHKSSQTFCLQGRQTVVRWQAIIFRTRGIWQSSHACACACDARRAAHLLAHDDFEALRRDASAAAAFAFGRP